MKAVPTERTEEERLEVWFTLMRAQAAVFEALERDLEASPGLPLSWYQVLIGITQDASGRMRMQELATFAVLSKSGLSRLVDRMEAAGLIRRESCSADRRGTYAALTPQGKKALEQATPVFLEGFERYVASHLSDADVRALQAALGKVLEANGKPASIACRPDAGASSASADRVSVRS
ncbi:MAG: MarR family winged helix-turn-helix transcriptional regulator [Actinomycetota bacterium]